MTARRSRATRRGPVAVLLAAVLIAPTACSAAVPVPTPPPASPAPTAAPEPSRVVVAVEHLGAGLNPHLLAHRSAVTTAVATLVLPSVFRPGPDGAPRLDPTIATSARVTATEPFTVTYELNLEASWSSNAPIAAEDFVYLWERMRAEPGTAGTAGYRMITDVRSRAAGKAVDVVFADRYPAWRELFTDLLPAHILKDAPAAWTAALTGGLPASGGPFRISSVDRARGEVVLARNDLYWDTPAVLDEIVLRRLDPAEAAEGLAVGVVDVALAPAGPDLRARLAGLVPPPSTRTAPVPEVVQLGMRADAGPTADPRVRRAVGGLVDPEAVRLATAPEALPAAAFARAPSEPGYAPTAPPRPDAAAVAAQLTAAGWVRGTDGRWAVGGEPVELVVGAATERAGDVRAASVVAAQLEAAGIGARVVAAPGVQLFGESQVDPATPATTAGPGASAGSSVPASPGGSAGPTPAGPTPTGPGGTTAAVPVTVDLMVLPRAVGGDPATALASAFGCPQAAAVGTAEPPSPTGFCFPALQLVLDRMLSGDPGPEPAAAVERVLWAQLPALPLYQPVTLVASTQAADLATGVGPGPLTTGPLTGAQGWTEPDE